MCGIIGYAGEREAAPLLLAGLRRLEYRGYDSAGIAVLNGELSCLHTIDSVSALTQLVDSSPLHGSCGIGHTRWATHGRVSLENAHPLVSCDGRVAVALNGIIENHRDLREMLSSYGHEFSSETDAEVVCELVEHFYRGDVANAVSKAVEMLEGHYAFVVTHTDQPGLLVATRRACPLVIGLGDGEVFLASSISAFLGETRTMLALEDNEIAIVSSASVSLTTLRGEELKRTPTLVDWDDDAAEKQGYETFMLKEIDEQPAAIEATIGERVRHGLVARDWLAIPDLPFCEIQRIMILSCGTSYHAGVVGRYMLESWARIPCEPDIASEWRYRDQPAVGPGTLVIGISQSGETADTLAALRLARGRGASTLAITNMPGSQITREAASTVYTRAGLEQGVAATKTFTATVALLALVALALAQERGTLEPIEEMRIASELERVPALLAELLARDRGPIDELAERYANNGFFLYLGRQIGLPVALEAALKMKEITYIPTDAYSAGEMKHGPIALLDEATPVICIATNSPVKAKLVSNMMECKARGAHVIAIADDDDDEIALIAEHVLRVPRTHPLLSPLLAIVPLQLFAYRIARLRELNVDRPRNLAKTVTVE